MSFWTKRPGRILAALLATLSLGFSGVVGGVALASDAFNGGNAGEASSRILPFNSTLKVMPEEGPFEGGNEVTIKGATPGFVQLSAGYYSALAVTNGGLMYGWGENTSGLLGTGNGATANFPTQTVTSGALAGVAIKKVSLTYYHSLALSTEGDVYAWGSNTRGQLGNGTFDDSSVPVKVERGAIPADAEIVDIGAGDGWSLAIDADGNAYVWGQNKNFQYDETFGMGNGSTDGSNLPMITAKVPDTKFVKVAAGHSTAALVTEAGEVYTWGWGTEGLLGNGEKENSLLPVKAIFPEGTFITDVQLPASRLGAKSAFALALDSKGQVWAWGYNNKGQLGNGAIGGASIATPALVQGLPEDSKVEQIANSGRSALALTADNRLFAWGGNDKGQLGVGTKRDSPEPVQVKQDGVLKDVQIRYIAGATETMFALGEDGVIYSWGGNNSRVLGAGVLTEQTAPVKGPNYGNLAYVEFDGKQISSFKSSLEEAGNYTTVSEVKVPPYTGTETGRVPVDVTGHFQLFAGASNTGQTASWPIGTYTYVPPPELSLTKSGIPFQGSPKEGDSVEWEMTVTNTGGVKFTHLDLDDALLESGSVEWTPEDAPTSGLPVGGTATVTGSTVLTQAHIDAGFVTNEATVTGTATWEGEAATADATASDTVDLPREAGISLTKIGDPVLATGVDEPVTWTIGVTNTGNTTLSEVEVEDSLPGIGGLIWDGGEFSVLAPGEARAATATYLMTQADIDAGQVCNTATASAESVLPGADLVEDDADDCVTLLTDPKVSLEKTGELSGDAEEGATVTWTFTVENQGNVTLTDLDLIDELEGLSEITWTGGKPQTLAPGAVAQATATSRLTQQQVDAGQIRNSATVTAKFGDQEVEDSDDVTVPFTATGVLNVVKTGVGPTGTAKVGDTITWTIEVSNQGAATVNGVSVNDSLQGLSDLTWNVGDEAKLAALAPGVTVTATATYSITQADIEAGEVTNTAIASSGDETLNASGSDTVKLLQERDLKIVKTGDLVGSVAADELVEWSFTVTNHGNVAVSGLSVVDGMDGLSDINWDGDLEATLNPGESISGTATSPLTQPDIDAGSVTNTVTVSGTAATQPVEDDDSDTLLLERTAEVAVVKSGSLAAGVNANAPEPEDLVEWSFTVTNTGNVTLSDLTVIDDLAGLSDIEWDDVVKLGALAPGESVVGTANSPITQENIEAGFISNTVDVSASAANGDQVEDTNSAEVELASAPAISIEKSGVLEGDADVTQVGDNILWSFALKNTGNVALTGTEITESMPELVLDWDGDLDTLAPGDMREATASYAVTQADIDVGRVENTVSAEATSVSGRDTADFTADLISDPAGAVLRSVTSWLSPRAEIVVANASTATVYLRISDGVTVVKTGELLGQDGKGTKVGDTIEWTFAVKNTGNTTVTELEVIDELEGLGELIWEDGFEPSAAGVGLAPGASATAKATYKVTPADVAAGFVLNQVKVLATGSGADRTPAEATDEARVDLIPVSPVPPTGGSAGTSGPEPEKPGGGLAVTGAAVSGVLLVAGSLLAAGLVLIRRRKNESA